MIAIEFLVFIAYLQRQTEEFRYMMVNGKKSFLMIFRMLQYFSHNEIDMNK